MHDIPILRDLVILVAVAIPVVVLAHRLRVPTIVGFLLAGMAIGPHGFGLVTRPDSVSELAEVGVVLLLFAIGLELSLSRVIKLGRSVVLGGGAQVTLTIALVAFLLLAAGVPINLGVFYGSLVALSSTAIVLKLYTDRGDLDSTHGRIVVAILLFQDLCVVPLMLLVPLLAGQASGWGAALRSVAVSLAIVGVIVFGGRLVMPKLLERVAGLRNREIFTLVVVCIGLAAAYVTSYFGLSLALGAFLAGLVISESEYGLQALSDVVPFRDTFSGIFFTSVGMLLDLGALGREIGIVLACAVGIILIKTGIVVFVVRQLKRSTAVGIMSGLGLAQIGEFSFVLAGVGLALGLIGPSQYQLVLGVAVLLMISAPFQIAVAERVAAWATRLMHETPVVIPTMELPAVQALRDHVIIVGYGLNGRNLARALKGASIPYVVLEQNGQAVRRARLEREPVYFGDGTRADVLEHVGISQARVIVFAIAAAAEERRGVAVARQANPGIRIVVRTRYVREIEELTRLGANEIVPEELETSIEIFARVLRHYGVQTPVIRRLVDETRADHYERLTTTEAPVQRIRNALVSLGGRMSLDTLNVEAGAPATGRSVQALRLRSTTGATVIAVIRGGATVYAPEPEFQFEAGDEVGLVGSIDALEKARPIFRATAPG